MRCNLNDFAILDGDIHDAINVIFGVQNMTAGEYKVIFVLAHRERGKRRQDGKWKRRGKLRKRGKRRRGSSDLRRCSGSAEYASEYKRCNTESGPDNRWHEGSLDNFTRLQVVLGKADTVLEPAAEPGICSLTAFFLGYLP